MLTYTYSSVRTKTTATKAMPSLASWQWGIRQQQQQRKAQHTAAAQADRQGPSVQTSNSVSGNNHQNVQRNLNVIQSAKHNVLRIYNIPQSTLPPGWNEHDNSTFYWHFFLDGYGYVMFSCFLPVRLRLVAYYLLAAGPAWVKVPAHSYIWWAVLNEQAPAHEHISTAQGQERQWRHSYYYDYFYFLWVWYIINSYCPSEVRDARERDRWLRTTW